MGAALLQEPEKAASIIRALRLALPIPVTCKIRLLDTPEKTLAFVKAMEAAGACAISVHMRYEFSLHAYSHWCIYLAGLTHHMRSSACRTRDDKPQTRANWEALAPIVQVSEAAAACLA
jgi:hypothetical protein